MGLGVSMSGLLHSKNFTEPDYNVCCTAFTHNDPHLAAMLRALERPGMPHSSLYVGASATSSNSTLAFSNLRMCEGGSEEGSKGTRVWGTGNGDGEGGRETGILIKGTGRRSVGSAGMHPRTWHPRT